MIQALIIPADDKKPIGLIDIDPNNLAGYQMLVGGNIELIRLDHPATGMWINEEGKLLGLPPNSRATLLANVQNSEFRMRDIVVGDAFVVGDAGGDGVDKTLPKHYVRMLTARRFIVRSKLDRSWLDHTKVYRDMWAAYTAALNKTASLPGMQLMVVPMDY